MASVRSGTFKRTGTFDLLRLSLIEKYRRLGWSDAEIADVLGVSRQTIQTQRAIYGDILATMPGQLGKLCEYIADSNIPMEGKEMAKGIMEIFFTMKTTLDRYRDEQMANVENAA